jgi:hypothetical protein
MTAEKRLSIGSGFHSFLVKFRLPSASGTICQIPADIPSGLILTSPQETKKRALEGGHFIRHGSSKLAVSKNYRSVRTSQETHYVSTTNPTGYCYL